MNKKMGIPNAKAVSLSDSVTAVHGQLFCVSCGKHTDRCWKFCRYCGKPLPVGEIARGKPTKQASQKLGLCYKYNEKGCENTSGCIDIHMCKNYVESKCERKECSKSHDILKSDVKAKLEKHGIDTKRKPEEILADLREAVRGGNRRNTKGAKGSARGKRTKKASHKLGLCYKYNDKGCEKTSGCIYIHMCKNYVESKCERKECSKSHDILKPDVKAKLEKHGIDTKRQSEVILVDLRLALRVDRNQGACGDSAQSRGIGYFHTAMTPAICYVFISSGHCRWGEDCFNVHSDLPYQWRWKLQSEKISSWQTVSSRENVEIENKYCDPANQDYKFHIEQGSVLVKFNSMTGQDDTGNVYSVQRVSTVSSLRYEPKPLTTVWVWYWKDENGKIKKYGNEAGMTGRTPNVSYSDIEHAYINNPDGQLPFTTTDCEYVIDFPKMVQRNVTHGTETEIVRRPIFLSESDVKERKQVRTGRKAKSDKTRSSMVRAPTSWQIPSGKDIVDHCNIVKLTHTDNEYKEIEAMFHKTLPTIPIKSIERIENGDLWWNYESKRQKMLKKKNGSQIDERRLFHGTKSQYIDPIWHQGFDFRLNDDTSEMVYGQGAYFALNASYSNSYTEHGSDRALFVAKVLTGEYVQGKSEYRRPPHKEKDNMSSELFDSCVNNEANPDIFIIFDNDQTYPEYLIRYCDVILTSDVEV